MNKRDVRKHYKNLLPKERSSLIFSDAIPKMDQGLFDSLLDQDLFDAYNCQLYEEKYFLFGLYVIPRVVWYAGRFSKDLPESIGYLEAFLYFSESHLWAEGLISLSSCFTLKELRNITAPLKERVIEDNYKEYLKFFTKHKKQLSLLWKQIENHQ